MAINGVEKTDKSQPFLIQTTPDPGRARRISSGKMKKGDLEGTYAFVNSQHVLSVVEREGYREKGISEIFLARGTMLFSPVKSEDLTAIFRHHGYKVYTFEETKNLAQSLREAALEP